MDGWVIKRLSEVCEKITDGTHQTPKYSDQGHIFLSSKNVTSGRVDWNNVRYIDDAQHVEMQKRISPRVGDILLAKNGTTGVAAIVDRDICFDIYVSLAFLRPLKFIEPKLLWYFINSPIAKEQFNKRLKGIGVPNLHLKEIREVQFPYPISPVEQKRIVSILDTVFADLEQTRVKTEQNLKNARELFDSYLQQVFSQKGDDWVETTLGDILHISSSKRVYATDWTNSGVPFFGGKEIVKLAQYGTVVSNAYISEEKYMDYASKYDMPQKDDILMTARGTIGVGYIVKEGDKFYYKDGNIISLRQKKPTNPHFILYAFKSHKITDQIKSLTGTTVNHLPLNKAKELNINTPSYQMQNELAYKIKRVEENVQHLIDIYEEKLNSIDELKKSILQKAFSGELTNTVE